MSSYFVVVNMGNMCKILLLGFHKIAQKCSQRKYGKRSEVKTKAGERNAAKLGFYRILGTFSREIFIAEYIYICLSCMFDFIERIFISKLPAAYNFPCFYFYKFIFYSLLLIDNFFKIYFLNKIICFYLTLTIKVRVRKQRFYFIL